MVCASLLGVWAVPWHALAAPVQLSPFFLQEHILSCQLPAIVLLNDSSTLKCETLPRPVNALVELHPLKAWRRALHTSCPSPRPVAVGYRYIVCCAVFLCERSVECRSDNENQITARRLHDHSPQLEHHGQLRELHAPTFWHQTLLVMLSPAFGLKHWYHAMTKSACFSSRLATTMMGIMAFMLTFCNQYKSSTRKPRWRCQTRATYKHAKIDPIRRVSFHFTEFHFPKLPMHSFTRYVKSCSRPILL